MIRYKDEKPWNRMGISVDMAKEKSDDFQEASRHGELETILGSKKVGKKN